VHLRRNSSYDSINHTSDKILFTFPGHFILHLKGLSFYVTENGQTNVFLCSSVEFIMGHFSVSPIMSIRDKPHAPEIFLTSQYPGAL
jgi:hypothetical protein